ncbi:4630_t:CDS:2, partial [Acaulospora colombiana]
LQHFKRLHEKLVETVPPEASDKTHIIVLTGECTAYRHDTDRELIFRQDHLFIPEEDPLEVLWSPAPPNLAQARDLYDATNIGFSKDFATSLATVTSNITNHMIHILPSSPLFPSQSADVMSYLGSATSQYLLDALHQVRLIKDEYEIELIKKANDISSRAHEHEQYHRTERSNYAFPMENNKGS